MEYTALYRKYRPNKFDDIVGQEHIIKILKNSIINKKIGHAYLFSGPRGTGKTSTAKVFANTVNCLEPKKGEKCGRCAICKLKENVDVIEIDAASNNGVDEIREIRQNAKLMPANSKYKVYIIDEVHMLSIGAFNALLKTLEEPPAHVIFILATTEFQKIPLTILSRCQKFQFKKLTNEDIITKLNEIVKNENIKLENGSIELISELSDGGLRDAINLLDQISSTIDGVITPKNIANITGIVLQEDIERFINFLLNNKVKEVLEYLNDLNETGKNYVLLCERIIIYLRKKLIDGAIKNKDNSLFLQYIHIFIQLDAELKRSLNQRIIFEVKILEILNLNYDNLKEENENVLNNIEQNEVKKTSDNIVEINKLDKKENRENTNILKQETILLDRNNIRVNNTLAAAKKTVLVKYREKYREIENYLSDSKFNTLISHLINATLAAASDDNIIISVEENISKNYILKYLNQTQDLFQKIYNNQLKIAVLTNSEWKEEIEKYKQNKKNKIEYKIIDEPDIGVSDDLTQMEQEAIDIFGKETIELK